MRRGVLGYHLPLLPVISAVLGLAGTACGDINVRDGTKAGYSYCQDISARFHFQVLIPPWKYNKEYRCSDWVNGQCEGVWTPTGRYVFVVSDVPFVNYDSEIITSMDVEIVGGDPVSLVNQLISQENIGATGSNATFYGSSENYPQIIESTDGERLPGAEVLWRQIRDFQGKNFNWYRRDVFLRGSSQIYHLRFFSIESLDKPEFEALIETFREQAAPDGAPHCECRDEHDPSGVQEC